MAPQAEDMGDDATAYRPPNHVLVQWQGDMRFDAGATGAPRITIDGDGAAGPGPIDTLLSALAACAASDVVLILGKQRTPIQSLAIDVVATRVNGTPRRLEHVALEWRLNSEQAERSAAERAIDLSITKYCSVRDSLNPAAAIDWRLNLNGDLGELRHA